MKMKKLIVSMIVAFVMAFAVMPLAGTSAAYAEGNTPAIEKSGDLGNFAKGAPITTVRLDKSKFTKTNATLVSRNSFYTWGTGESFQKADSIWTPEVTVTKTKTEGGIAIEGNEISLPPFSVTLKDAAIMRDNTTKDLKITFDDVTVFTKRGMDAYIDRFRIASLSDNGGKPGIDISPASLAHQHFGLRAKVTCQVVGAAADDTLLLVATEINSVRSGVNFETIKNADNDSNYSESMQFLSGIDSESDIYLARNSNIRTVPADVTNVNGYNVRFIGDSDLDFRLSSAVSASGASANVWSSAGNNPLHPLNMYFISPNNAPRNYTSSSGDNGKIELWTDGLTHDVDSEVNSFRKLAGGTIATPYTYAVPYGKEVTYRMTPDEGYVLDKLYINGSETHPTNTVHKLNSTEIAYYEYRFDGDAVNDDQEISVTWKKYAAITNPVPVRKIITGNVSDKDQDFEFQMSYVSGPREKSVDNLKITVAKGSNRGEAAFGSLTFAQPGEYIYQISEVDGKASGYSYDDKVYTVTFVIEYDQNDPDVLICTQQTILDGENEVDSCEFVSNYEPKQEAKPVSAPADAPTPGPKVRGLSSTGGEIGSPIALAVLLLGLGAVLGRRSKTLKH